MEEKYIEVIVKFPKIVPLYEKVGIIEKLKRKKEMVRILRELNPLINETRDAQMKMERWIKDPEAMRREFPHFVETEITQMILQDIKNYQEMSERLLEKMHQGADAGKYQYEVGEPEKIVLQINEIERSAHNIANRSQNF